MPDVEVAPLLIAIVVCVAVAAAGNAWVGNALTTWYANLVKPRFLMPIWGFIAVGASVYFIEAVVLYRLLVHVDTPAGKWVSLAALVVVMVYNEAWNYVLFGLRNLVATMVATAAFLAPLLVLMVSLFAFEPVSGWLMFPYCVWVIYDLWWVNELRRLNP